LDKAVSLFIPCIVDVSMPRIGAATVSLLRHVGCRPFYHEKQTCCGQILYNAGHAGKAKELARRFIEIFENDELIVSPSASCVHMVRKIYPTLFCDEPAWCSRAVAVASRLFELFEFIVDKVGVEDVGARFEGRLTYHESCSHLYGLEISEQPKRLIRNVKGAELVDMAGSDICCGFGGHFSTRYPEISTAMVAEKVGNFIASRADWLLLCEPGCLLNIGGYASRHYPEKRVSHLAVFLETHLV
jgi:L-lactate dehydrogenase complex protein LldE